MMESLSLYPLRIGESKNNMDLLCHSYKLQINVLLSDYITSSLWDSKHLQISPKKLTICFSGTACVTVNPHTKYFYCISNIHIEKLSIHRELSV